MKKYIALLLLVVMAFGGCAPDNNEPKDPNKPYAGTSINVYNWGDYIAEDTIKKFTEATGIKVNYEMFDSNEIMYAKYKSGAVDYDVLVPSDYMIEKLMLEGELVKLNKDNLPNLKHISKAFKGLAYDPDDAYSVPYMWGTVGILYNTDLVEEPVDSWDILWDDKYEGQIIMQNSVRDAFAVALKKLGYSLNSTNKEEVDEALSLLQNQAPLVQAYLIDEMKDKMIGNEAALAVIYSGEALFTAEANDKLAYAIPKEGTNLWFDAMVIPKSTKNQAAAEAFINFMLEPEIAFNNSDYIGYSTPHQAAKDMMSDEVKNNPAAYPSEAVLKQCEVYIDLGIEMTEYYNEKWNELKATLN